PPGLLEWTLDRVSLGGLGRLSEPSREALQTWLGERTGAGGRPTLAVVRAGQGEDALSLALIAGLLADAAVDPVRAAEVRGVLAHRYGGQTPAGETARTWAEAAQGLVGRRLDADHRLRERLARAESILASA